jgi:HPt (histidine-containing phosphotransfer) domain-containing protein
MLAKSTCFVEAVTVSAPNEDLDAAIAALWTEQRAEMLHRVDVVEAAVVALGAGGLGEETRAEAERAAHRIAGAAGSFGFGDASDVARELEHALHAGVGPEDGSRLAEWVRALRADFERPSGGAV